ncbi:VOC family protein [Streptomyces erythrochromogenes]
MPPRLRLTAITFDCADPEALLLELGASKPQIQPGGDRWRVFLDPAGHPFCLSPARRPDPPAGS